MELTTIHLYDKFQLLLIEKRERQSKENVLNL